MRYPSSMRLLITGARGMLGQDVCSAARDRGHAVVGAGRAQLDITDSGAVRALIERERPDAVINCAAWTDVDGAEAQEDIATAVNGSAAGHVAAAAAAADAFTVQVSTDYVFDGAATEPYPEDHPPAPKSAYGRSKLAGEVAVAAAAPGAHAIVRTAWVFGPHGGNFVATMLRLGAERDEVTVVDDQIGCPTYTGHLAEALVDVAERRAAGVLHVVGRGRCSWFDLAVATFARSGLDCRVLRGSSADLGRPAPRPAFSVLGATRSDTPALPPWEQGLDDYLAARLLVTEGTHP
jgi:dTDP-4-dehydrorhamnose reductase